MKNIVLFGASDQCRHTIDIIEQEGMYTIAGILDMGKEPGTLIDGYPVLGYLDVLADCISRFQLVGGIIAIGDNFIRRKVAHEIIDVVPDFSFITTIHPSAIIGKQVLIGPGCTIMEGVIINNNCTIGAHCNLWTRTSLDHDSTIHDYSSFSPGVVTGGRVTIGECTVIGISASILHYRTIGDHCVIGGGSLVNKNIPDYSLAWGVPARVIRERTAGEKYL